MSHAAAGHSPKRIGIWAQHLSAANPRGIGRVARGLCSQLRSSDDVEYVAVTDIQYNSGVVTAETYPLDLFYDIGQTSSRTDLAQIGMRPKLVPAASIDSLLSFECFETIWKWPLRHLGIRTACIVCDLIPFRVDELRDASSKTDYFTTLGQVVERADMLLCISHATADDLKTMYPMAAAKTGVISLGCGRSVTEHELAAERLAPKGFAATSDTATILLVGTVENRKNFHSVLAAAPLVAATLGARKLRVVMVGDAVGPGEIFLNVYEQVLGRAEQSATVIFTGYIGEAELLHWYRTASVFVFPSFWEGFGFPILEAMLFGVPVVASDIPCHREVGGGHVRYCDPYDVDDIAQKISEAMALPPRRRAWEAARARAWAQGFTWTRTAEDCQHALMALARCTDVALAVSGLQQPVGRRAVAAPGEVAGPGSTGFLFSLTDLIVQQDLRHLLLLSLLREHAGTELVLVLAIERGSLEMAGADYVLAQVKSLADAAPSATIHTIPVGSLVEFTIDQVEILALIDELPRNTCAGRGLTAADVVALEQRRSPVRVGTLYTTGPDLLERVSAETLAYDEAVIVDGQAAPHRRPIEDSRIQELALRTFPDPAPIRRKWETDIYVQGGLAATLVGFEPPLPKAEPPPPDAEPPEDRVQLPKAEPPPPDAEPPEDRVQTLLRTCPALEEGFSTLVLTRSITEYREARAIAASLANSKTAPAVIVLVVDEGGPGPPPQPGLLALRPEPLRTLILAATTVVERILDGIRLPDELRFAATMGKRVVTAGPPLDPLPVRLFGIESYKDLGQAIRHAAAPVAVAAGRGGAGLAYPRGIAIVIAAVHGLVQGWPPPGVDPVSVRVLLRDPDVRAFGERLKLGGIDGGAWDDLVGYLAAQPESPAQTPARPRGAPHVPISRALLARRLGRATGKVLGTKYADPVWTNVDLADSAREERDWPTAARHYQKALAIHPGLPAIWVQLGHALKEEGKFEEAERAYRKSLELGPEATDTYLQLGHVLKLAGRTASAEDAYFTALVHDAELTDARQELLDMGYTAHSIDYGTAARQERAR